MTRIGEAGHFCIQFAYILPFFPGKDNRETEGKMHVEKKP